jgi:hypothetical protein
MSGTNIFNTQLFVPYSWYEIYRVFDNSYHAQLTDYSYNTTTDPTRSNIKTLLSWYQYTVTWSTWKRIIWSTSPDIVAFEFCDVFWYEISDYTLETYMWTSTWTTTITYDAYSNLWVNSSIWTWFDTITCQVPAEYSEMEVQNNVLYSIYVYIIHITVILAIFLVFYLKNLFVSRKF